jgi:hypothetical protein
MMMVVVVLQMMVVVDLQKTSTKSTTESDMRLLYAMAAALAVTGGVAPGEDDDKPTPEELRQAEVYRMVDEMIDRRDKMLPRFAVVLYGERIHVDGSSAEIDPVVIVRAKSDKHKFELVANNGKELVTIDNDHLVTPDVGRYIKREKKQPLRSFREEWSAQDYQVVGHDPFDDWVASGTLSIEGYHRHIETIFYSGKFPIDQTKEGLGGQLTAIIKHESRGPEEGISFTDEITFSRAHGGLPIRVVNKPVDAPPYEQRIKYKRHPKHGWLPDRVQWIETWGDPDGKYPQSEFTLKAHWLVGKDFTDALIEKMIAGGNPDELPNQALKILSRHPDRWSSHLAPLLDHFEVPREVSVGGTTYPAVHIAPEDLYDDDD